MDSQKISKIANLIEIAENNLKTAQILIKQLYGLSGGNPDTQYSPSSYTPSVASQSDPEANFLEVVEGNFDGESMIGDDGKMYAIPANYASKTKLVVGDRMKRILTDTYREVYKVIQKAPSKRVVGIFTIDENNEFVVMVDSIPAPIRVLKASITFAMKQQNLKPGDTIAILIPANTLSTWGAFDSIVRHQGESAGNEQHFYADNAGSGLNITSSEPVKARPSLDQLKEGVVSPEIEPVPYTAGIPNPFDSLDEFRM
jgi:hypothetical protein